MFNPTGSRILVRRLDLNTGLTQSGLHIPVTGFDDQVVGEVAAVGPGRWLDSGRREQMRVRTGERVFFTEDDAEQVQGNLFIVAHQNVLGTVEQLA